MRAGRLARQTVGSGPGHRQWVAAGLGASCGHRRARHAELHLEHAISGGADRRAGAAALLALLAFPLPVRRPPPSDEPPRPWQPGRVTTSVAVVAAAAVISGIAGVIVGGAALGLRHLLRRREKLCEAVTVALAAGGLISGAVLSQNPWRSVDGYAGHSVGVQLLALVSVAMLAASAVPTSGRLAADLAAGMSSCSKIPSDRTNKLTFENLSYSVSSN